MSCSAQWGVATATLALLCLTSFITSSDGQKSCLCGCLRGHVLCSNNLTDCYDDCKTRCDDGVHTLDGFGNCIDQKYCNCIFYDTWMPICAIATNTTPEQAELRTFSNMRTFQCYTMCYGDWFRHNFNGECPSENEQPDEDFFGPTNSAGSSDLDENMKRLFKKYNKTSSEFYEADSDDYTDAPKDGRDFSITTPEDWDGGT